MIYFKLLLILFILIILLFISNQYHFKETFQTNMERVFNIYKLYRTSTPLECNLDSYVWPEDSTSSSQRNYFNFIMDNNFTAFKELESIRFEHQLIKQLHKQTFNALPKLNYVSFHGNPINLISSDILINNMGKTDETNSAGDTRKLVLSLPQNNDNGKILITCYENVFSRLSELSDYSSDLANLDFDNPDNLANTERKIYDFLYANYSIDNNGYVNLIKRALGVDETTLAKFDIYKKNNDIDVKLTSEEIVANFEIVYYKDVCFTTDMAFWRTSIFNTIETETTETTQATEQSNNEFITKYAIHSNVTNEYLTPIHIMLELITLEKEIINLQNTMGIDLTQVSSEINGKEQRINHLEELQNIYLSQISNYRIPTNVFEFYISTYINECRSNTSCDTLRSQLRRDAVGRLISPEIAWSYEVIPEEDFDFNIDFSDITECTTDIDFPSPITSRDNQDENCNCNIYNVTYDNNGITQNVAHLSKIDPTINIFYSMHHLDEHLRHKNLTDTIRLFSLTIDGSYYENMIKLSNLFLAIPTLGRLVVQSQSQS